jgi:hypothetical protein
VRVLPGVRLSAHPLGPRAALVSTTALPPFRVAGVEASSWPRGSAGALTPATQTTAAITCPECQARAEEQMPTNACQYFYRCQGCETTLKPLPGDCCVFCSYSDTPCPPRQIAQA